MDIYDKQVTYCTSFKGGFVIINKQLKASSQGTGAYKLSSFD